MSILILDIVNKENIDVKSQKSMALCIFTIIEMRKYNV